VNGLFGRKYKIDNTMIENERLKKKNIVSFLKKIWFGIFIGSSIVFFTYYSTVFLNLEHSKFALVYWWIGIAWTYPIVVMYSISSLTIFFNTYEEVWKNRFYNFLSFYILPLIFLVVGVTNALKDEPIDEFSIYIGIIFFICLTIGYIYFLYQKRKVFDRK